MNDHQLLMDYIAKNNYKIRKGVNSFHLAKENAVIKESNIIEVKDFTYKNLNEIFLTSVQAITFLLFAINSGVTAKRIKSIVIGGKNKKSYSNWWYIKDLFFPIGRRNTGIIDDLKKNNIKINPILEFMTGKINNIVLADLLSILENNVESGKTILVMVENNKNNLSINQLDFIRKKIIEINDKSLIEEIDNYVIKRHESKELITEIVSELRCFEFNYKLLIDEYDLSQNKIIDRMTYEKMIKSMISFLKNKELKNNIENITLITKTNKKEVFYLLVEEKTEKKLDIIQMNYQMKEYFKFYAQELIEAEKEKEKTKNNFRDIDYYLKLNLKKKKKNLIQYIMLNAELEKKSISKTKVNKI